MWIVILLEKNSKVFRISEGLQDEDLLFLQLEIHRLVEKKICVEWGVVGVERVKNIVSNNKGGIYNGIEEKNIDERTQKLINTEIHH